MLVVRESYLIIIEKIEKKNNGCFYTTTVKSHDKRVLVYWAAV